MGTGCYYPSLCRERNALYHWDIILSGLPAKLCTTYLVWPYTRLRNSEVLARYLVPRGDLDFTLIRRLGSSDIGTIIMWQGDDTNTL